MKLKPRDRSEVYDRLIVLTDKLLKRVSACSTCPISCKKSIFSHHYSKSWCCEGCPHLGLTGCTVEALGCKLWLCSAEKGRQTKHGKYWLHARLYKLQLISHHYRIWLARASKEESLKYGHEDFWYIHRSRTNWNQ